MHFWSKWIHACAVDGFRWLGIAKLGCFALIINLLCNGYMTKIIARLLRPATFQFHSRIILSIFNTLINPLESWLPLSTLIPRSTEEFLKQFLAKFTNPADSPKLLNRLETNAVNKFALTIRPLVILILEVRLFLFKLMR